MKGKLTDASREGMISPLVDVLFNSMAAMFLFLIIYICIVRPPRPVKLRIHHDRLPAAVWYKNYVAAVAASGGQGYYTFSLESPPVDGLEIDRSTGWVRGNPRPPAGGAHSSTERRLTVKVRDAAGDWDQKEIVLPVSPAQVPFDHEETPLRLVPSGEAVGEQVKLPDAFVGRPYGFVFAVLGGVEPYKVAIEGRLPAGVEWRDAGLEGTPELPGTYTFTVTVTDQQDTFGVLASQGQHVRAEGSYRIDVLPVPKLTLETAVPEGRVGVPYVGAVVVPSGVPPFVWSFSDLPPGLRAIRPGVIEGTPGEEGEFTVSVEVRDAADQSVTRELRVTVLPRRPDLQIVTESLPPSYAGSPFQFSFSSEGGVAPVKWSVASGRLPEGLELDQATIGGVPRAEATERSFVVQVEDQKGTRVSKEFKLLVFPAKKKPRQVLAELQGLKE